ncbi:hypothetical protein EV126DRAFT_447411 [Verticillium dahliae]|nr:hypothetical protein EV126DRAFT_447411 [Verticillium dahliae]
MARSSTVARIQTRFSSFQDLLSSGAATRAHDDQKGDKVDTHSFASSAARHTCPLYLHPDTRLNRAPVALLVTGHTTVTLSHVDLPVARDAAWWSAVQLPPLWKSRRQRP